MSNLIKLNSDLGKSLVKSALDAVQTEKQKRIVEEVTMLARKVDECEKTIRHAQRCLGWYRRKLKAIEKGQFVLLDSYRGPEIHYANKKFNGDGVPNDEVIF